MHWHGFDIATTEVESPLPYECYRYNISAMHVTTKPQTAPWVLLVFSLPAKSASERVQVWRKLQKYGMLALRSSGYVLPNSATNQERMEWLAAAIRAYKGAASVVQVWTGQSDSPSARRSARYRLFRESLAHED